MTQKERIKAVIFDWAGTVIDYGCFAPMHAFIQTFEEAGVPITIREARIPMGLLKWDHIQAILQMGRVKAEWVAKFGKEPVSEDVDRLYVRFEAILMESLKMYTDPIPGALETVSQLRDAKIAVGSTTGYTSGMMEVIVPEAKQKGYSPDFMIASDEAKAGRPYPYMIFQNLTELGIYPPRAVVKVGDTVSDIHEGRNAGVWTVAVILGSSELGLTQAEVESMPPDELTERMNQTRRTFEQAGADYIIGSINQLPAVIEELERSGLERGLR
ncbi:phosphonoacetaldehyde hydrolase [Paenibacillus aceris]|uniref:Phosphonoacetaldehyde hydrolase n=1 Tax=Paenibacillus aceris TaxID=869555 RepID=A0ABS4HWV9_9BACL|nr:phosphonoacetaldehyde hydrolase [Paenibacillus aceris]MBP1963134.1 phosphonoacetaldehyde hydrolase [Paenibacillus aceris]NHW38747.1 phosphonoacetaldehyde hydrolase [Paenibacillus aceris]